MRPERTPSVPDTPRAARAALDTSRAAPDTPSPAAERPQQQRPLRAAPPRRLPAPGSPDASRVARPARGSECLAQNRRARGGARARVGGPSAYRSGYERGGEHHDLRRDNGLVKTNRSRRCSPRATEISLRVKAPAMRHPNLVTGCRRGIMREQAPRRTTSAPHEIRVILAIFGAPRPAAAAATARRAKPRSTRRCAARHARLTPRSPKPAAPPRAPRRARAPRRRSACCSHARRADPRFARPPLGR